MVLIPLLLASPAQSQAPARWPPITPEELALKESPAGAGAPAILLYREVVEDDNGKPFQTYFFRIKVLTEEGKKYANIEIVYVPRAYQIEEIRARTVRSDGTAVEFAGQVFDKVVVRAKKVRVQVKALTLPEVHVGSIIEYSYKVQSGEALPDVLKNPGEYVIKSTYSYHTTRWVVQQELFTRRARFTLRSIRNSRPIFSWSNLPEKAKPQLMPDGTVLLEVENVPAFREEEYMPPENLLKASVDIYYVLGATSTGSFWRDIGKQRAEVYEKFIGDFKSIKKEAARLVAPGDAPETKLRKLYARAQKIRYVSYERVRTEKEEKREGLRDNKSVEDVLERGYGYANEINFLFVAFARAAGFQAAVVELASRSNTFFNMNSLDVGQLDAIVVAVHSSPEWLYFDPATRFCPFHLLPWGEAGAKGLRLSLTSAELVSTPDPKGTDAVLERRAQLQVLDDGSLKGTLQVVFTGQVALDRRLSAYDEDEAGRKKEIEDEVKSWLPAGATVEILRLGPWEASDEPLRLECNVLMPNVAVSTGRRLLLPPAAFQTVRKYPFQHDQRQFPIHFQYPWQEVDDLTIEMPTGFRLENLPAPRNETTSYGRLQTSFENQGSKLRFVRRLAVEGILYGTKQYPGLRAFFERVRAADQERLVLSAAQTAQP